MNDRICDIAVLTKQEFLIYRPGINKQINTNFIIKYLSFHINRIDGHKEYFGFANILYKRLLYDRYWNLDKYQNTFKEIFQKGLKYHTKS